MTRAKTMPSETTAAVTPKLRFPEFRNGNPWDTRLGNALFNQASNRDAQAGLPILAITKEHGAIPRSEIDYHVSASDKSIEAYKEVCPGDFIISLRSFQGGIEYSSYHGVCSPAYVVLRKRTELSDLFFKYFFKSNRFIQQLTKNLEGLRDGKMISYKQFSELLLPWPKQAEQWKIAEYFNTLDELIGAESQKFNVLKAHKTALMQRLFPREGKTLPYLRFPEFQNAAEWELSSIQELIDKGLITGHLDGNHGELYPLANEFSSSGVPYISANDFAEGYVDFKRCRYLSESRALKFKKGVARNGDILFAHNATVGPVAKLRTPLKFVVLSTTATYFRCDLARLLNDFLKFALTSSAFVNQYSRVMAQSTRNQVPITAQRKFFLQIPSLPEQQRIASCLGSLDDVIAAQSMKLESLRTHKRGLMQQLFPTAADSEP